MVEHSIRNRAVIGSIPICGSFDVGIAGVAQLVERQLPKLDVVGSNPITRLVVGPLGASGECPGAHGNKCGEVRTA